ncbi:hypothetical protein [Kitasatospora aureofaciens]|uniref:hypothetical protein n=1 Tax=Kitasatospora aureofaciens TaxID=1894 RepID=UPI0037C9BF29
MVDAGAVALKAGGVGVQERQIRRPDPRDSSGQHLGVGRFRGEEGGEVAWRSGRHGRHRPPGRPAGGSLGRPLLRAQRHGRQAANLLLFGGDPDYTAPRKETLDTYEQRRTQADNHLQRVTEAVADDAAGQRAVRTVIGELGRYEALVARAQLLEEQAHAPAGRPSADALAAEEADEPFTARSRPRSWRAARRPAFPPVNDPL